MVRVGSLARTYARISMVHYADAEKTQNQNEMQLIIAKNRHGQSAVHAKLNYNSKTQKISD